LTSRWRIVADKTPGCGAAAGPLRTPASSSFRLCAPSLLELETPSFAVSPSFPFPFSFSAARSRLWLPFMTPAPLRAASNCLDASQSTGRDRLPEPSELAGAREGAGAGVIEVLESVGGSKMKAQSMRFDPVTWTVVWVDAYCLARTCPCSERTETTTWPQMEGRMRCPSSAASWSQPERTPSGQLQQRSQSSSRLVCQVVRSDRRLVLPRK